MNILGLDLSLNAPGFCLRTLARGPQCYSASWSASDGDQRLVRVHDTVQGFISGRRMAVAVIEAVPPYATSTAALERVHAAARIPLARYRVPLVYVSPTALKVFAAGSGSAEKQAMVDAVPDGVRVRNDNEADAYHLAEMGRLWCSDLEEWRTLPGHQIEALSKVPGTEFLRTSDPVKPVQCKHDFWCTVRDGVLTHPLLLDPCDKGPKPPKAKGRR